MRMRVAILGAGFAGLSTAWHLIYLSQGSVSIDIYDPLPIGKSTSGLSSGLLHPFTGKEAKRIFEESKKLDEAHYLIGEASQAIGGRVVLSKGILRPAVRAEQELAFKARAQENPADCSWWSREECEEKIEGLILPAKESGGLYIRSGLTLDVPLYLEGLWQGIAKMAGTFHQEAIQPGDKRLERYQVIVYAMGSSSKHLPALKDLPLLSVKGQLLKLRWPAHLKPLPMSLVGDGYLVMSKDLSSCIAGATFETSFAHHFPDPEFALPDIHGRINPFFAPVEKMELIECVSGIRATSKRKLPIVGKVSKREWCITGLGAKGLLYHGALGKNLAQAILSDNPSLIPQDLLP